MGLPGKELVYQLLVHSIRRAGFRVLRLTLGFIVEETVNLGGSTVVGANGETVVSGVENQVLTHDGQTDQTKISTGQRTRRSADIDAGEAGAEVSCNSQVNSWQGQNIIKWIDRQIGI